jgi:alkanesulfonate monooxygenase SsuD/methylene tetrahydromethanopterin reductase-like flavin-dependent oxidoreductase (luciferase family)
MRIGISICSSYGVDDPRRGAQYMVERARAANDAGLDSMFVGDHHVTPAPYYQNTAILARMLAEWGDKPAGALYLLPLWHPVLLAEQVGTLAAIARGRFVLQCALGGDRRQSRGMGVDPSKRVGMFEESLEIMRRLWAGEEVTHQGHWRIEKARISPRPVEPVEVWIGSMATPAINRTARMAEGWLASPALTVPEARDSLNLYRQSCAEHNRQPTAVGIRKDVYVGATSQAAQTAIAPYLEKGYRGFSEEALVVGSVQKVIDELSAYGELGYSDIIVRNITQSQADALSCIEKLAEVREALSALGEDTS